MAIQTIGIIVKKRRIRSTYFLLDIYCPCLTDQIKPGQFIMLKTSANHYPFLRRPFSIYQCYSTLYPERKKRGHLSILFKNVGKGTKKMSEFTQGQRVDMIGPLGNGFVLPEFPSSANVILIGGGVGIVSLYPLANTLGSKKLYVLIGGKTLNDILCVEDFKKLNATIFIATEDGSLGFKGTVIDLFLSLKKKLKKNQSYYIYSCGPVEMLKGLAKGVQNLRFFCQASLESRMGCGFGACWGCVVKTKNVEVPYQRVCKEGPIFNLNDMDWG